MDDAEPLFKSGQEVFEYLSDFMKANIADIDLSGLEVRDYREAHPEEQDGRLEGAFQWIATHEYPAGTLKEFVSKAAQIVLDDDADAKQFLEDLRSNIFDP